MNRSSIALLAATALAIVAPGALAAPSPVTHSPVQRLSVIEHATTDRTTDNGRTGDSAGDVLTFHNRVYDAADRRVVGRDQGSCTRISPKRGSYECGLTVILARGQLTVAGPFYDHRDSTLAVTGGTGRFRHARGEMGLVSRRGGKEYAFKFRLARG